MINEKTASNRQLPKRIAIFRALGGLGDLLCIVPALRALRIGFPRAEVTLVGLAATRSLVARFSTYVDRFLEFPGYPGLPEQTPNLEQIPAFFDLAQAQQFDLALQMHGSGILTNPLTVLLGADENAGFFLPGEYCPDPDRFLLYDHHESEVRRYLRLLEYLGIPRQGEALEFPVWESDRHELFAIPEVREFITDRYVCIHPGASVASRRWSVEQFAIVGDFLANQGFQVVLTGSLAEVGLTQAVAAAMEAESLNLAGQTSLGALAALLQNASLLVCNDTGVSHLAAALQIPSVVIFTTSDPQRWSPLDRTLHHIVCTDLTPETVISHAKALLQETDRRKAYVAL